MTFFLIDDDTDDRELFQEAILESSVPISFLGARDAEEATSLLSDRKNIPSVIFLDINLPRTNGWQLLRQIKSKKKFSNVPVIMYSTSAHDEDREKAMNLGASTIISKPTQFAELVDIIKLVSARLNEGTKLDFFSY